MDNEIIEVDTEAPPEWYRSESFDSATINFGDWKEGVSVNLRDASFADDLLSQKIKDPAQRGVFTVAIGIDSVSGSPENIEAIFGAAFPVDGSSQDKAKWLKCCTSRKAVSRILSGAALFDADVRAAGNE